MKKSDYQDSDKHIFYCPKEDWWEGNPNISKNWDLEKVNQFWEAVRAEKMAKEDYNFSEFVFPIFLNLKEDTRNFWALNEEKIFKDTADFSEAQFIAYADFNAVTFKQRLPAFLSSPSFNDAVFFSTANFNHSVFDHGALFQMTQFLGTVNFTYSTFNIGYLNFLHAKFSKNVYFNECRLGSSNLDFPILDICFDYVQFLGQVYFTKTIFLGNVYFQATQFLRNVHFERVNFKYRADFKGAVFRDEVIMANSYLTFLKNIETKGIDFSGAVLQETHFFDNKVLEGYNFQNAFLLSLNLSDKDILNCNFTGAVIGLVQTKGWRPDAQTLRNTKYVYTDYTIVEEGGKASYSAVEDSRVPADGYFGEGEFADHTLADFLSDPISWSYSVPILPPLRVPFISCLQFFTEYSHMTQNIDVQVGTFKEGKRMRVELSVNESSEKDIVKAELQKYINMLFKDFDYAQIEISNTEVEEVDKRRFLNRLEFQISQFRFQFKEEVLNLIKYGKDYSEFASKAMNNPSQILISNTIENKPAVNIEIQNNIKQDLAELYDLLSGIKNGNGEKSMLVQDMQDCIKDLRREGNPEQAKQKVNTLQKLWATVQKAGHYTIQNAASISKLIEGIAKMLD